MSYTYMEARVSPGHDRCPTRSVTTTVAPDHFSDRFVQFCDAMVDRLDAVHDKMSGYFVEAIEMHIELTPMGEFRLVAASGADVEGTIKVTFRAKSPIYRPPPALLE